MKQTSSFTKNTWLGGDYVDERRAMVRATIQKVHQRRYEYHQTALPTWKHEGRFATMNFNQDGPIREIPGIISFKWTRGFDQDVATATMVIANVQWINNARSASDAEFDFPGWFTPNRGIDDFFDDWNYDQNTWANWFIPDRLIRTYEGYGSDANPDPAADSRLYPSGTWLVDDVELNANAGTITLTMRDLARILTDTPVYFGVIPNDIYPLYFEQTHGSVPTKVLTPSAWKRPKSILADSNRLFIDSAYNVDGYNSSGDPTPAVTGTADVPIVHTHKGSHAIDNNTDTHWLSAGSADAGCFEYLQLEIDNDDLVAIQINPKGGPFKVFISVFAGGAWKGAAEIPYQQNDDMPAMPGADLPFVRQARIGRGQLTTVKLPRTYKNVTKVRLTFQSQWDSGIGKERHYRTGIQEIRYAQDITESAGPDASAGNYNDYSDIIKWLTAWNGFYWPANAREHRVGDARPDNAGPDNGDDWTLPKGGVFGDVRKTFTKGIVKLDREMWDKQPLMDGISTIRDIVGFNFWVNEYGGIMWRLPNWFNKGNYLQTAGGGGACPRVNTIPVIDERVTLLDLSVKLSSKNIRERIFISNVNGRFGTTVRGYNPAPIGQRRTSGWTDQHFKSRAETRRMANLIAIRQFYLYRQNTLTIAANPALQVDDQIIIKERTTGEGYLHHIENISSEWSADTGEWTYQLTTSWMGPQAFTKQAWKPERLDGDTRAYLGGLGVNLSNGNSAGQ